MPQKERSLLRVEGKDDEHAINHLLLRHDIDCGREDVAVDIRSISDYGVEETGGREKLLEGIPTAVITNAGRSVGFILDADEVAEDRWRTVRGRLDNVGLTLPDEIPKEGFVGEADTFKALAWQESPGLPYGTAIRARYFSHDSANALAFVEWFRRVFL